VRSRSCISKELSRTPKSAAEWHVWHLIHLHHSLERGAYMAVNTLVSLSGRHRTTVTRAINGLLGADLMRVQTVNGRKVYRLPVDEKNVINGVWTDANSHSDEADLHKDDADLHQNDAPPHTAMCKDATSLLTPAPVSEVPLEDTKEVSPEVTPPAAGPEICTSAIDGEPETPSEEGSKEDELTRSWLIAESAYKIRQSPEYQQMMSKR